jgi:hypothetical protein
MVIMGPEIFIQVNQEMDNGIRTDQSYGIGNTVRMQYVKTRLEYKIQYKNYEKQEGDQITTPDPEQGYCKNREQQEPEMSGSFGSFRMEQIKENNCRY